MITEHSRSLESQVSTIHVSQINNGNFCASLERPRIGCQSSCRVHRSWPARSLEVHWFRRGSRIERVQCLAQRSITPSGCTVSLTKLTWFLLGLKTFCRGVWSRFPVFTASIASITFFAITVVVVAGFLISSTSIFTTWFSSTESEDTPGTPAAMPAIGDMEKPLRRKPSKRKSMVGY
jgi:hypothetical protein